MTMKREHETGGCELLDHELLAQVTGGRSVQRRVTDASRPAQAWNGAQPACPGGGAMFWDDAQRRCRSRADWERSQIGPGGYVEGAGVGAIGP